jgi:hypothetical protein
MESPLIWHDAVAGFVPEGSRHATALSIIGHLLRRRVDLKLAAVLSVAWGRAFCKPPLNDAEVLTALRDIARKDGQL